MAYIEENLKIRSRPRDEYEAKDARPADPQEELYSIAERWKTEKKAADEGSVTNSLTMLTAIPEVDLGMEYVIAVCGYSYGTSNTPLPLYSTRLKNIEDTEKAKRIVAEERQDRKKPNNDEEHLAASRCESCGPTSINLTRLVGLVYRPNLRQKSDADILRDAKLEAMGMPTPDEQPRRPYHERTQMATDEMVGNVNVSSYLSDQCTWTGYGTLQEEDAEVAFLTCTDNTTHSPVPDSTCCSIRGNYAPPLALMLLRRYFSLELYYYIRGLSFKLATPYTRVQMQEPIMCK
jgi:hypothetical protein